jgi:hypothetical protein
MNDRNRHGVGYGSTARQGADPARSADQRTSPIAFASEACARGVGCLAEAAAQPRHAAA